MDFLREETHNAARFPAFLWNLASEKKAGKSGETVGRFAGRKARRVTASRWRFPSRYCVKYFWVERNYNPSPNTILGEQITSFLMDKRVSNIYAQRRTRDLTFHLGGAELNG